MNYYKNWTTLFIFHQKHSRFNLWGGADHVRVPIHLGELKIMHNFVVVNNLVSPVILGVDFLQANALVLDFTKTPVEVTQACQGVGQQSPADMPPPQVLALHEMAQRTRVRVCGVAATEAAKNDVIDECAVPLFHRSPAIECQECEKVDFIDVIHEYCELFRTIPGTTQAALHYIPTEGTPVRVPPRRIPAHFRDDVNRQIKSMLDQEIIE